MPKRVIVFLNNNVCSHASKSAHNVASPWFRTLCHASKRCSLICGNTYLPKNSYRAALRRRSHSRNIRQTSGLHDMCPTTFANKVWTGDRLRPICVHEFGFPMNAKTHFSCCRMKGMCFPAMYTHHVPIVTALACRSIMSSAKQVCTHVFFFCANAGHGNIDMYVYGCKSTQPACVLCVLSTHCL